LGLSVRVLEAATTALAEMPLASQLVIEDYPAGRLAEPPGLLGASRNHGAIITSPTPDDEAFLETTELLVPVVAFQRQLARHASVDVDNVRQPEGPRRAKRRTSPGRSPRIHSPGG